MANPEQQVSNYLNHFNDDIAAFAKLLREHLREETKPTYELAGDSTISLNIGYGFTEKAWDCYCAIIIYSKHINISLPSGALLQDPNKILHGTGKKIRHIKIKEFEDIKIPAIVQLITTARNRAIGLLNEPPSPDQEIKTIVKPISGVKKRAK